MNTEPSIDRYVAKKLTPAEARELAQAALDQPELFDELTHLALVKVALESDAAAQEPLERYVAGGLSASEERQLAQAALENEELFDALAAHGAAEQTLDKAEFRAAISKPPKVIRFSRKSRLLAVGGAIAAAIVLFTLYLRAPMARPGAVDRQQAANAGVKDPGAKLRPTPDVSAGADQPVLLAIQISPRTADTAAFRGDEQSSRPPRGDGSILSVEDGVATVDLGSVDGLAKGSELQVVRGSGRLTVTTVFRDSARARVSGGSSIGPRDHVRMNRSDYLGALAQQVDSLAARGDSKAATDAAQKALAWADSESVTPGEKRGILERLAALEYDSALFDAAAEHYRLVVNSMQGPPPAPASERIAVSNNMAALYLLEGDEQRAEALLVEAVSNTSLTPEARASRLNNLGVLAEVRGDARKAESIYKQALSLLDARSDRSKERRAVEANLARVKRSQ